MDWADALALELPEEVYDDVRQRIDALRARVAELEAERDELRTEVTKLQTGEWREVPLDREEE